MRLVRVKAILAALAFVVLSTVLLSDRIARQMPDLEVYWRAGVRAAAGEPLYRTDDQHYQFKYLPGFAVLAIPLGVVPLGAAKTVWFAASVALLIAFIALSVRLPIRRPGPTWLLVAAVIVTMGKFFGHELILGQVNLLFGVVAVGSFLALRAGREALAGALVALAIVVKPYAVIFLPWIAAQRRIRATLAAAAGLVIALMLPLTRYDVGRTIALHWDWWQTVTGSTAPNLLNQDNVSIAAMLAKWLGPGTLASGLSIALGALLLLVAVYVFIWRRDVTFPEGLEGSLLLTLIPLLSPQGWDYVFLIATPAVVYVVNYRAQLPAGLRILTFAALATLGLSLVDVLGRANYARFMALSIITLCFFIVIAGLVALRVRRVA
jgi:arabinofuranan 3-O-arabinosyltransferase